MLRITNEDFYNYNSAAAIEAGTSSVQLARIDSIVSEQERILKDAKYKLAIFKAEKLRIYKANVWYPHLSGFVDGAREWNSALKSGMIKGEKLDKRKNYDEKNHHKHFLNELESYLGHKVEIKGFSILGYSHYGTIVEFECDDKMFSLQIPVVERIGIKEMDYDPDIFKLRLCVETSSSSRSLIGSTYEEEELGKILDKYLEVQHDS